MIKKRWHTSTEWKKGYHPSKKTEFKKGNTPWSKIHGHSDKTKEKISKGNKKTKQGVTPLRILIRMSPFYKKWRSGVFSRDKWTCQTCQLRGCILEAHHIKPFVKILKEYNIKTVEDALKCEELWNLNNGVTLCKGCHNDVKKEK